MSYQVLARKWRPRNFDELVGQEHVVRALRNALDGDRVHHAFLFTGTRGVGKTTLARILAKCLNCESGMTSSPCGECGTCAEVDQGRFVDLIEVDAASRAKVEQTRELMDNVQYTPNRGRHKVYLIDEVHMFSAASFNALLKTLEEPPPHVKFLLATTDPQKVPVTVLSRCLQFNLKRLPASAIASHIEHILSAEGLEAEAGASGLLARAADGSMRDALSLLDQAIAYGAGRLGLAEVKAMLGTVEQRHLHDLLEALTTEDGPGLLAAALAARDHGVGADEVLDELLRVLQRIAVAQAVPEGLDPADETDSLAMAVVADISPEDVQLYYQIAILGRRDLSYAPDPDLGLQMILLRMLAFRPETGAVPAVSGGGESSGSPLAAAGPGGQHSGEAAKAKSTSSQRREGGPAGGLAHVPARRPAPVPAAAGESRVQAARRAAGMTQPSSAADSPGSAGSRRPVLDGEPAGTRAHAGKSEESASPPSSAARAVNRPEPLTPEQWPAVVSNLGLQGLASELANNSQLTAVNQDVAHLRVAPVQRQLANESVTTQLCAALSAYLGRAVRVALEFAQPDGDTPADVKRRVDEERRAAAVASISADPAVQAICDVFDGRFDPQAIRPVGPAD